MKCFVYLSAALTVAGALAGGPAFANTCQADNLTCPTTMPVGGYCECRSHGTVQGGTVVGTGGAQKRQNATAGGCGAQPNAAGCR